MSSLRLRRIAGVFALSLFGNLGGLGNAAEISNDEKKIVAIIESQRDETIAMIEKVVNIPSATQNLAGVREVGKAFQAEFEKIGFQTRWDAMPATMKRAGHLIAERPGSRGKRLLLIGHLDTVLEGKKFERVGDKAFGTGTVDMKAGDVIVLQALKALFRVGALDDRRIAVIFTGDEEDAGSPISVSRASMRELAKRSDVALAFEAVIDDTAIVARRGVSTWSLTVKGETGHSSGIFRRELGTGAIFETARILDTFRQELSGEKDLTFNASLILGGTEVAHEKNAFQGSASGKTNVVPPTTIVQGDLRFLSEPQREAAEERMRAIVSEHLPKTSATIEFIDEYPAMSPSAGNYELLKILDKTSRDLGFGPVKAFDPGKRGAGDISFVAPLIDSLDGLGADGEGSHAPGESINLDALPRQVEKAAILIHRLTRD